MPELTIIEWAGVGLIIVLVFAGLCCLVFDDFMQDLENGGYSSSLTDLPVCPDCGVAPGYRHRIGCDVERCPDCGGQFISCDCEELCMPRLVWDGGWPGVNECREFGWYAKMIPGAGWVQCDKHEPGAREDLNRLSTEAEWSASLGRFVLQRTDNA